MAVEPPYRTKNMMPGMIMLWYGSIVTIPTGWALCDGNNNTPDLRLRFVFGASAALAPDTTGGSLSHQHAFTGDGHGHDLAPDGDIEQVTPSGYYAHSTTVSPASGTTDLASTEPPWYALCYIMKLPIP